MPKFERGYVSLSQIDGFELTQGRGRGKRSLMIISNIPDYEIAPGVDIKDSIRIKPKKIFQLMRAGAMRKLTILGSEGKSSQYMPEIAGEPGSDGSALAGMKVTEQIAPAASIYSIGDESLFRPLFDSTVSVNLTKINETLSPKGELRSPGSWAREFNRAIKDGLRKVALKNVLPHGNIDGMSKTFVDLFQGTCVAFAGIATISGPASLREYLTLYGFVNLLTTWGLITADRSLSNTEAEKPRFSILPGNQPERVGIIYARSKIGKIAK